MKISIAQSTPQMKRKTRSPQHPFNIIAKPWQIQPMFIAPVMPGETLKNLLSMSRVVSDPLKDKLMGWWCEYYFFYVKHTDMPIAEALVGMHLNASADMSAHLSAAYPKYFHNGGLNYVKACLDAVLPWYFRDSDDAVAHDFDGVPIAKINTDGWWQSAKLESEAPLNDHELPGDNPGIPDNVPPGMTMHYQQWEQMRALGLTPATFEDYLASFGVKPEQARDEELKRPELLRYERDFTYPTNTVEPTTGIPSSAAVWSPSIRADKDRFFREPGFLFGVQVVRPKVLLSAITGSITSYMYSYRDWLPAILHDLPFTSLKEFATGTGPAPVAYGEDYWVDLRDLFLYGEQFRNHDLSAQGNKVALPSAAMNTEWATQSDADALFAGAAATRYIRTDGIVTCNIASPVHKDMTQ